MPLVVDASVAVKFLVREHDTDKARDILRLPDPLIAPDWLLIEAASTFWKKVKRSELLAIHAERHLEDMPRFFARLYPSSELVGAAFSWSIKLRHSVYDCLYLALAVETESRLVTADEAFYVRLKEAGMFDRVMLL